MKKLKWIVAISIIYLIIGVLNVLYVGIPLDLIQIIWLFTLTLPWWNTTVKHWLKIE